MGKGIINTYFEVYEVKGPVVKFILFATLLGKKYINPRFKRNVHIEIIIPIFKNFSLLFTIITS